MKKLFFAILFSFFVPTRVSFGASLPQFKDTIDSYKEIAGSNFIDEIKLPCKSLHQACGQHSQAKPKKKILIAWSKGGGAHKSMLDALREYLCDEYEVIAFNPLERIWTRFDLIRSCSCGYMDGEDFYNSLLANDYRWIINKIFFCGTGSMRRHTKYIEDQLELCFRKERPDLIISVIPIMNYALNEVGRRLHIPFLMIAPDCDTTHYLNNLYPTRPFYATLPFKDDLLRQKANASWIEDHFIKEYGFPLRKNFFEPKNKKAIIEKFGFPEDAPRVMLLNGATGSSKALKCLKHLAKIDRRLHLIICIGKSKHLKPKIQELKFPANITYSIIGFTKRIPDLMAVSDMLISKEGASTVCEAVHMELPLILDHVSEPLEIERLQPVFVQRNKLGELLTCYEDLPRIIHKLLDDTAYVAGIRARMKAFSNMTFPERLKTLIEHILSQSAQKKYTPEGINPGMRWLRP